jgi:hypothetical protein
MSVNSTPRMYGCLYFQTCVYVYMYVYMYVCVCVCVYTCVYLC